MTTGRTSLVSEKESTVLVGQLRTKGPFFSVYFQNEKWHVKAN